MLQRMGYGCMCVGIRVRAALTNAICRRSFSMASIGMDQASDAVSFVASDINKVRFLCLFFPSLGGGNALFCCSSLGGGRDAFFFPTLARCFFGAGSRDATGSAIARVHMLLLIISLTPNPPQLPPPPKKTNPRDPPNTTKKTRARAPP